MNKGNGDKVTLGPGGQEIKLRGRSQTRHVQVLRSIALQVLQEMVTETETVNGLDNVRFIYHAHLMEKLEAMGERNPASKIEQLLQHSYLVRRTSVPDAISYYIFPYKSQGQSFRGKLNPKPKAKGKKKHAA